MLSSIPSPSSGSLHLGPLQLRAYGLCIALGVWAAVSLTSRRYRQRGGDPALITSIAIWAVPGGIIGARLYHVITDYQLYTDHPFNALKIWDGGLGIWGGVLVGVAVGAVVARRHGADVATLFDCVAPALPLAQAIGRWGNWFNQELFGRPTSLPWGLEISRAQRPLGYEQFSTFHPTFLYESLWDLCVVGIVLAAERRLRLRRGTLLAAYVAAYTFGRFFTEYLRIDKAHKIGPLRLNDWTSVAVFVGALAVLAATNRQPSREAHPAAARIERPSTPRDASTTVPRGPGKAAVPASVLRSDGPTEPHRDPGAGSSQVTDER
ncbi:MAG: prolipoprotein diacylglyceryl transferase [Acidimicrobiales bacterium]